MRYRQVHLDFHTSDRIPGIGSRFDPKDFAATLSAAKVDSITLFSKCHHGVSYHPTKVGKMHPGLDFDLLRAQVEAAKSAGINTPVYLSAGFDEYAANLHPEWRIVDETGALARNKGGPLGAGWAVMDFGTPYLDYLCEQVDEAIELFPENDGIFIDICAQQISLSSTAQALMETRGLDWTDPEHRIRYTEEVQIEFFERVTDTVRRTDPNRGIFFNFGHVYRGRRHLMKYFSHLELESLPTAEWGYEHFPISARYVEQLGKSYLGMTGKFHFLWGEFGGYKHPDALVFESAAMVAHGAACSIGDHLHPTGEIDKSTYAAIGKAYDFVESVQPWLEGSKNVADIGVISAEAADPQRLAGWANPHIHADEGVVQVLVESKLLFDVLDLESDFSPYRLLILPDTIALPAEVVAKLEAYVATGGRVLMTGTSGISDDGQRFLLDTGARPLGESQFKTGTYLLPIPELRASFLDKPLYTYYPSQNIELVDGESLGEIHEPYFDRDPRHFSGHLNTANQPDPSRYAAGSRKGGVTYLAHPIFTAYNQTGAVALLEIAERAIRVALGAATVESDLPRAARLSLRHQPSQQRHVLHITAASPVSRGKINGLPVQPLQEVSAIPASTLRIRPSAPITAVRTVPDGVAVPFTTNATGEVSFETPVAKGSLIIELATD
ncbi:MAG: beta-galactosidase trimerization domain-containing protein [Devosia sp.]